MNSSSCCQGRLSTSRPEASTRRRITRMVSCVFSGVMLIVMPKCPVCVASYVMLLTGASISTATAGHMRACLILLCFSLLVLPLRSLLGRMSGR